MAETDMYSLTFKKKRSGATLDSASTGVVCLEGMPAVSYEAKDVYQNDWMDEDGLEIFDADSARMKATNMTFPMGIKGIGCNPRFREFVRWLTTGGMLMDVEAKWLSMELKDVVFVKADPDNFYKDEEGEVLTFKLTIRITTPV